VVSVYALLTDPTPTKPMATRRYYELRKRK
jgi:hypothetical protein